MPINSKFFTGLSDWIKQVISLSSGAIVLITAFMDKLARAIYFRWTVKLALSCFVVSIIAGLYATLVNMTVADADSHKARAVFSTDRGSVAYVWIQMAPPIFLIIGLLSLVVFVCNNF